MSSNAKVTHAPAISEVTTKTISAFGLNEVGIVTNSPYSSVPVGTFFIKGQGDHVYFPAIDTWNATSSQWMGRKLNAGERVTFEGK